MLGLHTYACSNTIKVWFGLETAQDYYIFCPQDGKGLWIFLKHH